MTPPSDLTFESWWQSTPTLAGHDRMLLFFDLPDVDRAAAWTRLGIWSADRHFVRGDLPLLDLQPARPKPKPYRGRAGTETGRDVGWQRVTDGLSAIDAETYLEILVPESEPSRGICRCPLPDHEDRHPSASYRDTGWYCHRCGTGGGVFQLGAALTGLDDRGPDFNDLRRWLAERLIGAAP